MDITIEINKEDIFKEVKKTTSYAGMKKKFETGDEYKTVSTTDYDSEMLDRFYTEASSIMADLTRRFLNGVTEDENLSYSLTMPSNFDSSLIPSLSDSTRSFFVCYIIAKWFDIANQADKERYAQDADRHKADIQSKLFYRTKPKRN